MSVKTIAATALAIFLATTAGAFAQTWTHDNGIYSDRFQDRLVSGYTNSARTNPGNTNGR
jgi:hypothetical protein